MHLARERPEAAGANAGRASLALTVIHPLPSAINASLVASLAVIAGGPVATAATLAVAMLGFQFSIGALNDVVDADADRLGERRKPIPAGVISVRVATGIALVGGAVGLIISTSFGPLVLVLGLSGYACGVAYDVTMRDRALGWLCYAAAFPLLIAWTWEAAVAELPPGWPFLLPVAAITGPALHLANSLVDVDSDQQAGRRSLATRLGPRRARRTLTALMLTVLAFAWLTLWSLPSVPPLALVTSVAASAGVTLGIGLSWQGSALAREAGWILLAIAVSALAAAWLASMVAT
jgi:4-hydroxybenzoate polyprenyltransferase